MPTELHPEETLDPIAGDWEILQLRRGHRFSTDDLACAWAGVSACPGALRLLDLGAGIGSVGLMALWGVSHRPAGTGFEARTPVPTLTMVEAQPISHRLARRTVAHNGLQDRVRLRLADLRDRASVPEGEAGSYDLVTGSPPYIPLGKGLVSAHPQRAACRMELRGDVFDYCRVAARALAPEGVFSLVHAAGDPRPERALAQAGLHLRWRQDICFRRGRPPTIAVFVAAHSGGRQDRPPLAVRDEAGVETPQWRAARRRLGAPSLL